MTTYIFASDPHGSGQPWIDKVEQMKAKYPSAQVVFGGDYIDGGKHSKETVDYVMASTQAGAVAIMGNHEQMMIDSVDMKVPDIWKINGQKTTIRSFAGRSWSWPKRVYEFKYYAQEFIDWVRTIPDIYVTDHIVFVHAGIDWQAGIQDTTHYDRIWARENYIYADTDVFAHNTTNYTIITGHTPTGYISGKYEGDVKPPVSTDTSCPVVSVQYPSEPARIFTDNGAHGACGERVGNVIVVDEMGNMIDHI